MEHLIAAETTAEGLSGSSTVGGGVEAEQQTATDSAEGAAFPEPNQLVTRELLQCSLEQLVSDINAKRKRDTVLLEDFKKALEMHCSVAYSSMQAALYGMYEQNSTLINDKLQELMSVMESIAKQEAELEHFKREMGAFYSDMQ